MSGVLWSTQHAWLHLILITTLRSDQLLSVALQETLESPLDSKEIQPVHPKGDQSWLCIGSTDVEAEAPILWPPDAKSWLTGKDSDVGSAWGQEETGTTEDEMAGWHHGLDGRESEWTLGVGDWQGGLACCDSWGRKKLDVTEWLNKTELKIMNQMAQRQGMRFACRTEQPGDH